jgi:signal transduction histidine kinase
VPQKWQDPEYREKFAAIVPQEIERINKIAESLLKFGRPIKPELTQVEVNSVLEEVILLFESECKKNNIRVTTKFASLPQIVGDASQLSQAFVNIALNAIQVMQQGGELTFKTDVGEVVKLKHSYAPSPFKKVGEYGEMAWGVAEEKKDEVEEGPEKGEPIPAVFVEITDTGGGIPEENLKSLFDPFFTTKVSGTGMGLPITLRIIEEHKGSIRVRSQVGKGTTFLITLPQNLEQVK